MPVVFDEVTANVEPEKKSGSQEAQKASTPGEEGDVKVRHLLGKLEQREARLRAD